MLVQIAVFLGVIGALVALVAYLSKRTSRPDSSEQGDAIAAPQQTQSISVTPPQTRSVPVGPVSPSSATGVSARNQDELRRVRNSTLESGEANGSTKLDAPYGIVTSKAVIATSSPEVARLLTQADALVHREDYATALQLYTTALRFEPNFAAQSNRGLCYLKLKRYNEAISDFRALILSFPNQAEVSTPLNLLGFTLTEIGRHRDAIEEFDKALKLNQSSAEIHFNRGAACRHDGQYDEAIKSFEAFLRLAPQMPPHQSAILIPKAHTELGELRRMNAPEIQDAMMNLFGHTNVEEAMRAMGFGGQPPKSGGV
jgi:tetratricopeptide (TPR) repeat protein